MAWYPKAWLAQVRLAIEEGALLPWSGSPGQVQVCGGEPWTRETASMTFHDLCCFAEACHGRGGHSFTDLAPQGQYDPAETSHGRWRCSFNELALQGLSGPA